MSYQEILEALDRVTDEISITSPDAARFESLCQEQEELIRAMNAHPDNRNPSD